MVRVAVGFGSRKAARTSWGHPCAGGIWLGRGGKDQTIEVDEAAAKVLFEDSGLPGVIKELVTFVQADDIFQQPTGAAVAWLSDSCNDFGPLFSPV